jgi:hypothetical protein
MMTNWSIRMTSKRIRPQVNQRVNQDDKQKGHFTLLTSIFLIFLRWRSTIPNMDTKKTDKILSKIKYFASFPNIFRFTLYTASNIKDQKLARF